MKNGRHGLDDPCSGGSDLSERIDVRHDIMPSLLLFLRRDLELFHIEVLVPTKTKHEFPSDEGPDDGDGAYEVGLHLRDRFVCDGQSELLLGDGEVEP